MTRYIQWGERRGTPSGATHYGFGGSCDVDPADLSTAQALWSALPPDLRLALAKTAPRVAGKWEGYIGQTARFYVGPFTTGRPVIARTDLATAPHWGECHAFCTNGQTQAHLGRFLSERDAQSACDAALRAQGYVLDGDTP